MENVEIILEDVTNPIELEAWKVANPTKEIMLIELIGNTVYLQVE